MQKEAGRVRAIACNFYPAMVQYIVLGRMAERSNAAVLKTVEVKASGGSNPSPSAKAPFHRGFFYKTR